MSKRLFAWLLAVVLALSMGAAPAPGQTPGAEQAEQGAYVSVQTPDTVDAGEDDAPAGELGEGGEDDVTDDAAGEPGVDDENDVTADAASGNDENDGTIDVPGGTTGDDVAADEPGEDDGADGEIVPAAINDMPVNDEPQTTADGVITVLFEGAEHITSLTADDADVLSQAKDGINLPADGDLTLDMVLEDGYYVQETDECSTSKFNDHVKLTLRDEDGDGTITVRILKLVKVTLVDEGNYVTSVVGIIYHQDVLANPYVYQGEFLMLEAKACALDVEGGSVRSKDYDLDNATGELSVEYFVVPDGSGDMTITTRADDKAPKPIKIEYVDPENKIEDKDNYILPGRGFYAEPADDYTISVEGDASVGAGYFIYVNEDAISIKVIVEKVRTGAKLLATTFPDAVESTDIYGMSGSLGRDYVGHNGTMANGKGWFILKNGYAVGLGVTGGSVWPRSLEFDETTSSFYTCYMVDATEDTVTVPIVEAQPYRWVNVKVDDDVGCDYSIRSVLAVGSFMALSGNGDAESLLAVGDELTAEIDPGYELEAVSGCTLRWEKDADGNITYRILPDEAGDTEVEVRVIQTTQQLPVVKVGTDADEGVQTDDSAESRLEAAVVGAIDALAGGNIPAGMSADMAEEFRAALEEADAVTVPEVSAVLNVKREADTTAFPDAVAVYEIEIVLSVNGQEVGNLTELSQPISISLPLPPKTGRIVYLVRSHGGKQEKLAATVEDGVIRFVTDQFSEFAIMSSNNLADAAVDPIPDQTWTGAELTPKVHVTISGRTGEETLMEGTDYTLSYKDNVEVGTATVTIMGMGDFAGTSVTVTFQIKAAPPAAGSGSGTGAKTAPQTGDETPIALYGAILALSATALVLTVTRRKKTSR